MKLPAGSREAQKVFDKNVMAFENYIKASFRNRGQIDQKWAVDVDLDGEYPEVEEGYMIWTGDEILSCFEPVVDRIIELVKDQISFVTSLSYTLEVRFIFHISVHIKP
jgi:hypothetical protein